MIFMGLFVEFSDFKMDFDIKSISLMAEDREIVITTLCDGAYETITEILENNDIKFNTSELNDYYEIKINLRRENTVEMGY